MKTVLFLMAVFLCSDLVAQQVVATAGNSLTNSGGGISYTVGEGITQTLSAGDVTLTQGFQQSNIFVSLVSDIKDLGISIFIYPNPTSGILKVRIETGFRPGMQYSLFDINGKELSQKKIESNETEISLSEFQAGIYLLKIQSGQSDLRIFKIVKR